MAIQYEIGLAYSSAVLATLTKTSVEYNATSYQYFNPVENFPPRKLKETVENTTLRGKRFKHFLRQRKIFNFIISTDDLNEVHTVTPSATKFDFIKAFFNAEYKYVYYFNNDTGGAYVEVEAEEDELGLEYIENILYLPEITFSLYSVNKEA